MEERKVKYTVIATGKTYHVRDDLKEWGFKWSSKREAWVLEGAGQAECNLFRHNVSSDMWPDVDLEVLEETAAA